MKGHYKTTAQKNKEWFWSKVDPCCRHCGYNKSIRALHFHHIKPEQKINSRDLITEWFRRYGRKTLIKRLQATEFIILCGNCHSEVHDGLWDVGEGNSDHVNFIGMEL